MISTKTDKRFSTLCNCCLNEDKLPSKEFKFGVEGNTGTTCIYLCQKCQTELLQILLKLWVKHD